MKYFHLFGEINEGLADKFYDFCNQNEREEWFISIHSGGGYTPVTKTIIHIINHHQERVTLVCQEAYSGAFEIFKRSVCNKILTECCKGMYHLSATKLWLSANQRPFDEEDRVIVQNWKESTTQYDFVKQFMTKSEIAKFKKGEDVYFTFKRMKEIFPEAQII